MYRRYSGIYGDNFLNVSYRYSAIYGEKFINLCHRYSAIYYDNLVNVSYRCICIYGDKQSSILVPKNEETCSLYLSITVHSSVLLLLVKHCL